MMANETGAALPISYGTTVATTSGPVLPANPSRKALIFVNPSAAVSVAIAPAQVNSGVNGVYTGLAAAIAALNAQGSITMAPGDKFIIDTMNCTSAWVGVASAAGGVLTILES
jgi:hypothetical protein